MEPATTPPKRGISRRFVLSLAVVTVAAVIVALFVESPPHSVLDKADLVGYAICHRITARSFVFDGRQLPLCARCTGTFLGAMLGLSVMLLLRRQRASRLPSLPILGLLVIFVGMWAFDGLNSYLGFFPGAPQLYEPQNWLRLTTGLLNGLALMIFVFPILNFTLWRDPTPEPVIKNLEMLAILPLVGLIVLVFQAHVDALLYPLAIISSLGVVIILTMVNSMIAAVVLRREGVAQSWRQLAVPVMAGLSLALLEITALSLFRAYVTVRFGLAF